MLGSNPSADSVASTDPGGCCGIPFQLSADRKPTSGEARRRKILGVRGQSPRRLRRLYLHVELKAHSHNA